MYTKIGLLSLSVALFTGCAQAPLADQTSSNTAKQFEKPEAGFSGIYVYRTGGVGGALKKDVFINDQCLGETAPYMFFYERVPSGQQYKITTESEFSANDLYIDVKDGENHFVKQYIKMGVFVGGADLLEVSEQHGKREIMPLDLARKGHCSESSYAAEPDLITPMGYVKSEGPSNESGSQPAAIPTNSTTNFVDENTPNYVYDNDFSTRWAAKGDNASLMLEYPQPIEVNAVRMAFYKGDQRISRFDILVSNDGTNWQPVITNGESSGKTVDFERFPFESVQARFIKYVGHGNTMNTWSALTEFKAVDCHINTCPAKELIN